MERSARDNDTRSFVQLLAVYARTVAPGEANAPQAVMPLVVDRTREGDVAAA